jgi:peptidyl-prolyl cis-trans isomerase D
MDAHVSFEQSGLVNAYEPKVIGAAFGVAKGKVSAPIQGNDGVYAIQVVNVEEPAKTTDYSEILPRLNRTMQQKSSYASEVQKKLAKVQDNRFDFF